MTKNLVYGHWIINQGGGRFTAHGYTPDLPRIDVDFELNKDVIVCIKGGSDRYTVRLKDLTKAIQIVESIPEEYVREVFVTRRQDEPLTFESMNGNLIMPLAISVRLLTRR